MKHSWILPLTLFFIPVFSIAQYAEEILDKARSEIAILCSDSLGGRGYIDNGHIKAAKYLSHRYEEMGLIPLLESRKTGKGTFLQKFPLEINLSTNPHLNIDGKDYQIGEDFIISRNSGYGSAKG